LVEDMLSKFKDLNVTRFTSHQPFRSFSCKSW